MAGGFAGGTYFLVSRTAYAPVILVLVQFFMILPFSESQRLDELSLVFDKAQVRKIRWLENIMLSIPVIICVGVISAQLVLVPIIGAFILGLVKLPRTRTRVIPTPFGKSPVLFPSGFRKSVPFLGIGVLIASFSIIIDNYNLGLFSVIMTFIIVYGYYSLSEPYEYIWIYSLNATEFLRLQLTKGIINTMLMTLPIVLVFFFLDIQKWYLPLVILTLGVLNLVNIICSRYRDFPNEVSIPNGIIVALSLMVPPVLIITIPYFYLKARDNLKEILG